MPIAVVMPALEMAQETGKLVSWLKEEGATVAQGEPLLEIETDKAVMEIESPGSGVLAGIRVKAGDEVPVGRTIAWILQSGEAVPPDETSAETGRRATGAIASPPEGPAVASARPGSGQIKISPKARRLAAERGVDIAQLDGSGADGEILASDVVAAAEKHASVARTAQISNTARLMAERTTQSWTTVPHFFVVRDVDAGSLVQARAEFALLVEQSRRAKLSYTDLVVALVARVLRKHPKLNSSWTGKAVRTNPAINIGIAVAVEDGVVAPVIHDTDKCDLGEIAVRRHDLTLRARAGKLHPTDLAGGTFTISNLGMFGVDAFSAIIMPPQAAVLAVGNIVDRVVPVDGEPGIRPIVTLTLSCDHRVADGARAAEFLRDLSEAIQTPQQWLRHAATSSPITGQ